MGGWTRFLIDDQEGGYEAGEAFYGSTWPAPLADDIESIVIGAAHEVVERVRRK